MSNSPAAVHYTSSIQLFAHVNPQYFVSSLQHAFITFYASNIILLLHQVLLLLRVRVMGQSIEVNQTPTFINKFGSLEQLLNPRDERQQLMMIIE